MRGANLGVVPTATSKRELHSVRACWGYVRSIYFSISLFVNPEVGYSLRYGYQSQTTYNPKYDFVITVATNIESSSQVNEYSAVVVKADVSAMISDDQQTYH